MVAIESAYWGDEKQSQNITKRILELVSGGKLDVTANEKLIPPLETPATPVIKLSPGEERQITQDAEAQCGPSDQQCLEFNKNRLRQAKLKDKEVSSQSSANVIKGRRLTLILNRDGKRVKVEVPDGNKYLLENIVGQITQSGDFKLPTKQSVISALFSYLGGVIGTTIYFLGILIPYVYYLNEGYRPLVARLWAALGIVPYLGYFIMLAHMLKKNFKSVT